MIITHEIRDEVRAFSHRLVAPGKSAGTWTHYQRPATLSIKNVGTFVVCTEYWKDVEPFPIPGKIYIVKEKS